MPSTTSEATFDLGGLPDPIRFCGYRDQNLNALEALIPVVLRLDGDRVHVSGDPAAVARAQHVLAAMLAAARSGAQVTPDDVTLAAGAARSPADAERTIPTTLATTARGREVRPKTPGQRVLVETMVANTLSFALGPAGTGKTFLAIVMAVRALKNREVARIVLFPGPRSKPVRSWAFCRATSARKSIPTCVRSTTRWRSCSTTG